MDFSRDKVGCEEEDDVFVGLGEGGVGGIWFVGGPVEECLWSGRAGVGSVVHCRDWVRCALRIEVTDSDTVTSRKIRSRSIESTSWDL